jgi:cytochrome c5
MLCCQATGEQFSDYVVSLASNSAAGSPGEAIFAEQCVVCHQDGGVGSKDVGAPALNNNIWLYKGGKDGVVAQVTNPQHGSMPAWSERLDETTIKMLTVIHFWAAGRIIPEPGSRLRRLARDQAMLVLVDTCQATASARGGLCAVWNRYPATPASRHRR